MPSNKRIQHIIALCLLTGTLISTLLVSIGGGLYLFEFGMQPLQVELALANQVPTQLFQMWQEISSLSSLGMIELGLLLLIATQILRVALLCGFYALIRDYKFFFISSFILLVLIYSSFCRS